MLLPRIQSLKLYSWSLWRFTCALVHKIPMESSVNGKSTIAEPILFMSLHGLLSVTNIYLIMY